MNNKNKLFSIEKTNNRTIFRILFLKLTFDKKISNNRLYLRLDTILSQLKSLSEKQSTILDNEKEFFKMYKQPETKPALPFLSVHLVDQCNNNCQGCSHFCTIANKFELTIEDYTRQLNTLVNKFHIHEIDLMGGEPLLHPNIEMFFEETRKILPHSVICLHTNGLLLHKMPESFWESCKKNHIDFKITRYPNVKDFTEIIDLCLKHGIYICGLINGTSFIHWMDRKGNGNIPENFKACKTKFGFCYILKDYRLYTCPTACYMPLYNDYFNENIPCENGIDIITASSSEILNYLQTPLETCKFCRNVHKLTAKPWQRTQRVISDWDDEAYSSLEKNTNNANNE